MKSTKLLSKEQKTRVRAILHQVTGEISINKFPSYIGNRPMGSGGKGQIKHMKRLKEIRIQLTYGYGKYNYADCLIINY